MGILIERADEADRQVYNDAWKDIESILNNAIDFAYMEAPKEIDKIKSELTKPITLRTETNKSKRLL